MKTITKHHIDGLFVESHGREVMDLIRPTDRQVIGRVTLGDEEDTRSGITAAKRAFATFGRTTKEERMEILRRLHHAVSARSADLTKRMVDVYGGASYSSQRPSCRQALTCSSLQRRRFTSCR